MKHLAQLPLRDLEVVLADNGVSEYHFTEYKDLKITVFALHHTVYAHSYKIDDGKLVFVCKNGKCFGNYPLQTVDEFWQLGYGNIRLQET